ncbi:MAG: hypothetical protein OQL19_05255 [Gammaproteobacteria bacterium]|nr:hypothetical protein [Gammaproteobacteria bacterium]
MRLSKNAIDNYINESIFLGKIKKEIKAGNSQCFFDLIDQHYNNQDNSVQSEIEILNEIQAISSILFECKNKTILIELTKRVFENNQLKINVYNISENLYKKYWFINRLEQSIREKYFKEIINKKEKTINTALALEYYDVIDSAYGVKWGFFNRFGTTYISELKKALLNRDCMI